MIWKYRMLLDNIENENEEKEINSNKYYAYFKSLVIDADDEL